MQVGAMERNMRDIYHRTQLDALGNRLANAGLFRAELVAGWFVSNEDWQVRLSSILPGAVTDNTQERFPLALELIKQLAKAEYLKCGHLPQDVNIMKGELVAPVSAETRALTVMRREVHPNKKVAAADTLRVGPLSSTCQAKTEEHGVGRSYLSTSEPVDRVLSRN